MLRSSGFDGKRVLVTGAVGSIGQEITRQLVRRNAELVRVIDSNESGLFDLEQSYDGDPRVECICCSVSDEHEMMRVFAGVDLCFHTAALKHVPSCERSPFSAVNVNIRGVENVIRAAMANRLERVLFTSSDKAVNPTNVMGTSKLMGERLLTAANFLQGRGGRPTIFASTRFGNVAGSNGSVVPLFCAQIARGGPVTVTDERMSRFIMSIQEAVDLVIESLFLAKGGEVFVTKMPVVRIVDLAQALVEMVAPLYDRSPADVAIKFIGKRPGEKLWEELSTDEESHRILESERYLVILPALRALIENAEQQYQYGELDLAPSTAVYHSEREPSMSREEIEAFLLGPGVLPDDIRRGVLDRRRRPSLRERAV